MNKGFVNLGNTCYFNSALQCLLHVPHLTEVLIFDRYECANEFTIEYQKLTKIFWLDTTGSVHINPLSLLCMFRAKFAQFDNRDPHDAQEAFVCLLDMLDQKLVDTVFNGRKLQETVCRSGKRVRTEKFTVDIMTSPTANTAAEAIGESQKWSALDNYVDDAGTVWNVAATRQTYETCPVVLALSFPTFCRNSRPIRLSQTLTIKEKGCEYDLLATCTHMGSNSNGHYVAIVNCGDGSWCIKDDTRLVKTDSMPYTGRHYVALYILKNSSG